MVCRKNGLIRKIRLISKFLTSQPGKQAITIHILPIISRSKGNRTEKFSQIILFFKNHAENEAGRLVPDFFLFFKKAVYKVKANGLQLGFDI